MTESVEQQEAEPLPIVAQRLLEFANRMEKPQVGIRYGTDQAVAALSQSDLIVVAQSAIDLQIAFDEGTEADAQIASIIEVLNNSTDINPSAVLQRIIAILNGESGDYPDELIAVLVAKGMSREEAVSTLDAMQAVIEDPAEADDSLSMADVDFGEVAAVAEPAEPAEDDDTYGPAVTVTDQGGGRRVIRPVLNHNPHVPEVDAVTLFGGSRDGGGRVDHGSL